MFRRKKKFKFFAVVDMRQPEVILTITEDKQQAIMYATNLLKIKYYEHFVRWAECHNFDVDDEEGWKVYFNDCITVEEKQALKLFPIFYTRANLASILRMFAGSVPLGCNFENDIEYDYFFEKLRKGGYKNNPLIKSIKANLEDIMGKKLDEEFGMTDSKPTEE